MRSAQELTPRGGVLLEDSPQGRGAGSGVGVHNTPGFHTVVDRFHGYRHIFSLKQRLQCHEDLLGQPLLHLGSLGEEADDAVDLAQANDLASRFDVIDKFDNNQGWVWLQVTRSG